VKLRKTISWLMGTLQRSLFPKLEDPKSGLCDNSYTADANSDGSFAKGSVGNLLTEHFTRSC
jgi:hypothetical protein